MNERRSLGRLAREPLYNTGAVAQASGVPADTFRAWERRYNLPRPYRTATNQRLYSERDIGVITWLRDRTAEGMTISQAIQRLRLETPEIFAADQPATLAPPIQEWQPDTEPQPARLRQRLLEACIAFDSRAAERTIDEALALFSIEEFCALVVEPVLVEIGARWSRHELSVATEHFATRLLSRRLSAIFTLVLPVSGRGTIVVACPAGEEHDLGLLVLAIVLSRRGWHVVYL
ncbi:MAG: MerR family transcriptional regulator, partial [Chloroflexota bacterium]|nr:MerR family transcriptional regulator [Chloroflexota bacterium]